MASRTEQSFPSGITRNLEPALQHHLKKVYTSVMMATGAAAVGSFTHMNSTFLGAGLGTFMAAVVFGLALCFTKHDEKNPLPRLSMLCAFAFCSGVNVGPMLQMALFVKETIVMEALLAATVLFASFSAAALCAPGGFYLYLGGTLMSLLSTFLCLSIFNMFYGSMLLFKFGLYASLLVMCGFIVYDTQAILEKRRQGDRDYVQHALDLFIDFLSVFQKLVIIMTDKEANKKKQRRN